ncbi:SDR family oxidoreductase [Benzoatithermus flavus]|uniref:SDR family oxidoreductase n=1 Tax=Benzoatithermus flavus TaxID=3108223 RepID=A0ABU8XKU6_9PROT
MEFKDRVVVITGASSGIGRATAHAFAGRGARVVLAARSADQLEEVERECADLGARALAVPTDVGSYPEVEELAARAEREFGGFDAWINDAGVLLIGRIDEVPPEDFTRVVQTNLLGTAYGARVALAHFRRRRRGTLINIASIVAGVGQIYSAAYVASKWGVRGLSEALRMEVKDEPGIHVCTVMPAAIDTPIFQHAANYTGHDIQAMAPVYPPAQVAEAIVRLMHHPRAEVTVGDAGRLLQAARSLLPQAVTTRLVGTFQERGMLAPRPEGPHPGNLYDPSGSTAAVHGGWQGQVASGATADTMLRLLGLGMAGLGTVCLVAALARRPWQGHAR